MPTEAIPFTERFAVSQQDERPQTSDSPPGTRLGGSRPSDSSPAQTRRPSR